jgi:hypothetical protein
MDLPLQLKPTNFNFDSLVYDTNALSEKQKEALLERTALEGSIIVVWPGKSERIEFCDTADQFLKQYRGKRSIDAITIAGVGSSDLGTAAFAKSVANGLDRPAIGIVTGYGIADWMSEAMGGFLWFGMRNRVQSLMDYMSGALEGAFTDMLLGQNGFLFTEQKYIPGLPECSSLLKLLQANQNTTKILVGHSKGNFSIANSLVGLQERVETINHDMAIVTFGCGVRLPDGFDKVHQYVGTLDFLGIMNTPVFEADAVHWLPFALHHINPSTPGGIDVATIIKKIAEEEHT